MPSTPVYGLRTPEVTSANDVPADLAVLAQGVEGALNGVVDAAGWVDCAIASGFEAVSPGLKVRRRCGIVVISGFIRWTGGSLTCRTVATVPAGYRPSSVSTTPLPASVSSNKTTVATPFLSSSGDLSFSTVGYIVAEPSGGTPVFPISGTWFL
ncbi:hypothetical protein ACTQ2Q_10095 [Atopobiaceae bacterium LCP21S3_F11]